MLFNEIVSGFFAGLIQIAVGHPFDTTKVLIQNKHKYIRKSKHKIIYDAIFHQYFI